MPQLHTLGNGLRVVLAPDTSAPTVGIALTYDVGSRDEEPGRTGYAHLFEHLMFEGSTHAPKGDHFRLIQSMGGQLNGTTSQDRTNYYCALPAHQVGLGLWLEADRMRGLALTPESFENQRQTVMEERRQRVENAPYGLASLAFAELSYTHWAYAHPIIGTWEDLRAARYEDARAFHERWYRPDNAVLALAGDLDPQEVLGMIADWYGDIAPGGPRTRVQISEPPRPAPRQVTLEAPLASLPALFISHLAPTFSDPDFYVYEVIETLLFSGHAGRLYRRLVVETAAAVEVGGGYEARRGPSLLSFYAVAARGGDLDRVRDLYLDELARLATEPVPPDHLERVCNQILVGRLLGQESALSRALALGRSTLYVGDVSWEDQYQDRIAAVRPDDILRVAARDLGAHAHVALQALPR